MHPIHKHMSSRMKARKSDERYDAKMAYDKNLSGKARLHYLENDIADKGMSMKAPMDMQSAMDMKAPMRKAGKKAIKKAAMAAASMVPGMGAAVQAAGAAGAAASSRKGKKKKSPADMKAPMRKESAKQEKDDLMKDNPVVKDATGRRPEPKPGRRVGPKKPSKRRLSLKDFKEKAGTGRRYGG